MIHSTDLDRALGQDTPGSVSVPVGHQNTGPCPHCGQFIMFRWGVDGFRAYNAVKMVRKVKSTGKRKHFKACGKKVKP